MAIQQRNMSCQNTNEGDMNLWQCSREIWVGEDGLPLQHPPQTWSALWFWSGLEIVQSGGDNKSTKGAKIEWAKTWSMMRLLVSWEKYFFVLLRKTSWERTRRGNEGRKWGKTWSTMSSWRRGWTQSQLDKTKSEKLQWLNKSNVDFSGACLKLKEQIGTQLVIAEQYIGTVILHSPTESFSSTIETYIQEVCEKNKKFKLSSPIERHMRSLWKVSLKLGRIRTKMLARFPGYHHL